MRRINPILLTDSYKVTHHKQYEKGTTKVYSYFESRGGAFPETVFYGLQYYIKEYLSIPITQEMIDYADKRMGLHFGNKTHFNRAGWEYILKNHGGRLPIRIKAVPEGTVVPYSNVLMTVENTDPECFWLTNYVETLLVMVWYPSTVATQSRQMKKTYMNYAVRTGSPLGGAEDFKLHDFGFRGSTSVESAGIGGSAHLVNFKGTDTFAALEVAYEYYGEEMAGFSIPAAEHSTITSWGKDRELQAFDNMLEQFPDGLVAVVSDSFDIFNACANLWGKELREKIINRKGTLVIRPDSGNPPEVVCKVLEILGEKFGYTEKVMPSGTYKTLPPYIRIIQGDGIDIKMFDEILFAMKSKGWAADNAAFGSGGGLLQKLNRDTSKYAFKCSQVVVNGEEREVSKDPVTDPGKKSKAGRLYLVKTPNGGWFTQNNVGEKNGWMFSDQLQTVYEDGKLLIDQKFSEIRDRAKIVLEATA